MMNIWLLYMESRKGDIYAKKIIVLKVWKNTGLLGFEPFAIPLRYLCNALISWGSKPSGSWSLRAILCKNQAKWEWKILSSVKFCMQLDIVGGCLKMHFVRVATLLLSFWHQLFVGGKKSLFLKSLKTLQPKTWRRYNTIILVYICVYCSLLYQICMA